MAALATIHASFHAGSRLTAKITMSASQNAAQILRKMHDRSFRPAFRLRARHRQTGSAAASRNKERRSTSRLRRAAECSRRSPLLSQGRSPTCMQGLVLRRCTDRTRRMTFRFRDRIQSVRIAKAIHQKAVRAYTLYAVSSEQFLNVCGWKRPVRMVDGHSFCPIRAGAQSISQSRRGSRLGQR